MKYNIYKIIQTFHCTLNRHAVGEEEYGPDEVYFSTDGKFVVTEENYGMKVERYNLEDLIKLSKNK